MTLTTQLSLLQPLAVFPNRVPCLALNQPYASLLFGEDGKPGRKSLESRLWPWPYPPGWLAVYATRNLDNRAVVRLRAEGVPVGNGLPVGAILGVVWIDGCRLMTAEDADAACYPFDASEGRYVWPITSSRRFVRPNREHLKRGPQKFVYVPASVIAEGLGT